MQATRTTPRSNSFFKGVLTTARGDDLRVVRVTVRGVEWECLNECKQLWISANQLADLINALRGEMQINKDVELAPRAKKTRTTRKRKASKSWVSSRSCWKVDFVCDGGFVTSKTFSCKLRVKQGESLAEVKRDMETEADEFLDSIDVDCSGE